MTTRSTAPSTTTMTPRAGCTCRRTTPNTVTSSARGAKNPLICIGINPSTAQPGDLDNTLKSVERIALGNGYDSFTMFNVYPQRAT
ncbi:MAG: DUF1643 domain-containing protein, partial [Oscillospiraceae bacterium]